MSKATYTRRLIGGEFHGRTETVPVTKLTPALINKVLAPISKIRWQIDAPYVLSGPQHKPKANSTVNYYYSPGTKCPEIKIFKNSEIGTTRVGVHPCRGFKQSEFKNKGKQR